MHLFFNRINRDIHIDLNHCEQIIFLDGALQLRMTPHARFTGTNRCVIMIHRPGKKQLILFVPIGVIDEFIKLFMAIRVIGFVFRLGGIWGYQTVAIFLKGSGPVLFPLSAKVGQSPGSIWCNRKCTINGLTIYSHSFTHRG